MHPAIFLDRDGVIIENRADYVLSWAQVSFLPGACAALARLESSPYKVVIVTNQSPIGRGLLTPAAASQINQQIVATIEASGGRVDGVFMCPHRPEEGCACRKPAPGLLLQAVQALDLDLNRSWVIGDQLSDLRAGWAAGVSGAMLVRTGHGVQQANDPLAANLPPFPVYQDLAEALAHLAW